MIRVWLVGFLCVGCIQKHRSAADDEERFDALTDQAESDMPRDMAGSLDMAVLPDAEPDGMVEPPLPPPVRCDWQITAQWTTRAVSTYGPWVYWLEQTEAPTSSVFWYGIEGERKGGPTGPVSNLGTLDSGLILSNDANTRWAVHLNWHTEVPTQFDSDPWTRRGGGRWLAWSVDERLFVWREDLGRIFLGETGRSINDLWIGKDDLWMPMEDRLVHVGDALEVLAFTDQAAVLRNAEGAQYVSWWDPEHGGQRWVADGEQRIAFAAPDRRPTVFPIWLPAAQTLLAESDDQDWGHRPRQMTLRNVDQTIVAVFENVAEAWTVGDMLLLQTRFGWPDRVKLIDAQTGRERLNMPGYDAQPVPGPGRAEDWLLVPETNESARDPGPVNLVRSVGELSELVLTVPPRSGTFQRVFGGRTVIYVPRGDENAVRAELQTGAVSQTDIRALVHPLNLYWIIWQDPDDSTTLMMERVNGARERIEVPGQFIAHLGPDSAGCEVAVFGQTDPLTEMTRYTRAVLPTY